MKYRAISLWLGGLLAAGTLMTPALAGGEALPEGTYAISPGDLQAEDCQGLLLRDLPGEDQGRLLLGSRQLRAGDVLLTEQLSRVRFVQAEGAQGDASISCLRLTEEGPAASVFSLKLGKKTDEAPVAEDSSFETYRNIPGQVPLTVSDPEGQALTVTICSMPKRGDVTVDETGAVTYTPHKNKVGKDSFTYTVSDPAGNVSREATVRVTILRPSDRETYGDMTGDPALLASVWLREAGIFSGETVAGQRLFRPEATVSRGEFLAMCAALTGTESKEVLSTGFADESETPAWLSPFVTAGLLRGYLRGVSTPQGLSLEPEAEMTRQEATEILADLTQNGEGGARPVLALSGDPETPLTRRDAALLLWESAQSLEEPPSLLSWARK